MSDAVTLHERDRATLREAQALISQLQRLSVAYGNALRAVAPEEAERIEALLCATA